MNHRFERDCIENASLTVLNSFRVPARAGCLIELTNPARIPAALDIVARLDAPPLILGGGSNLLLVSELVPVVLRPRFDGIQLLGEEQGRRCLRVAAGVNWHELVRHCVEKGWPGLENLALIPGTTGAAPVQNIGAYGVQFADVCRVVEAVSLSSGETRRFEAVDCQFGYRDSRFKREAGQWLITSVELSLPATFAPRIDYPGLAEALADQGSVEALTPGRVADAVERVRRGKLPGPEADQPGCAGSFFKNPVVSTATASRLAERWPELPRYPGATPDQVKLSAAWLIEQDGWKGYRDGDAGVYHRHALVLVNHGQASGAEIWALARRIMDSVEARFGVRLEPEPLVI